MERTILVGFGAKANGSAGRVSSSLDELKRLVETAGGAVERTVVQWRAEKNPATLVGRGKAEEIAGLVRKDELDAVIFDDDLTPAQQKNLQEVIPAKVIDRTRLILDIFAQRARTREGILQVELAQLNYLLPRATEKFGRFEQQTGGIGTRGPGERKLEVDQRHIRARIDHLKRQIEQVRNQRALQRENRQRIPLPIAALIGYTNVGKSSLLNALDRSKNKRVYADDKLFATLDPTTRRVKLPGGKIALFVDTVGFIQKLPHHLVASFHATLEEIKDAQLLLHVLDASSPEWPEQYKVVQDVLKSLGADGVPQLLVFNKVDLVTDVQRAALQREGRLLISVAEKRGLKELLTAAEAHLEKKLQEKVFVLPHGRRDLLPVLYKTGRVLSEEPLARGTRFHILIDPQNWGFIQKELQS